MKHVLSVAVRYLIGPLVVWAVAGAGVGVGVGLFITARTQAAVTEICDSRETGQGVVTDCLSATRFTRTLSSTGAVLIDRPATPGEQAAFKGRQRQDERLERLRALPSAADLRTRALAIEGGPGQSPLADVRALSRDLADALRLLAELRE